LLDLATGQETLVALPLSYWLTGSQAKSLANCVEGVEPTSSRVVAEVTLSFTTSHFVALQQKFSPGGKSSRAAGRQPRIVSQTK